MMRLLLLAFVLCAPLSAARAGEGSSWSTTFVPDALATYLGDTPARYMVVPAGGEAPEFTQAEQALVAALRTSGKALLVMTAQALGSVAQLDDAAIVKRGASFPVDRVVVLRLVPDASGALTQAVVVLYDMKGAPLGSFSAMAGTALASWNEAPLGEVAAAPQTGVPAAATPAASVLPAVPSADPVEQYEQQHIGFDEVVALNVKNGDVTSQWTVPYEGKYKKPLRGEAFYQKVGREDLGRAYQDKMSLKTAIGIAGGAAILGGGILAVTAITSQDPFDQQRFDNNLSKGVLGIGIAGAGVAVLSLAIELNPHPVTASEARELADGYNKRLKADLGLSEAGKPLPSHPPSIQARFTPLVGPGGAGLLLSGNF